MPGPAGNEQNAAERQQDGDLLQRFPAPTSEGIPHRRAEEDQGRCRHDRDQAGQVQSVQIGPVQVPNRVGVLAKHAATQPRHREMLEDGGVPRQKAERDRKPQPDRQAVKQSPEAVGQADELQDVQVEHRLLQEA